MRTGPSSDSSPSRVFLPRGMRWLLCTARAPYHLEWVNERSPHTRPPLMWGWYHENERVYSSHSCRWCGADFMWMRVPSTHGSRWCGAGIMWMRVSSTHGRLLLRGWYRVNKRALSSRQAATDEGLVSCEWVRSQLIVICPRQNAALRRGAACLDSGFFRVASAATWEPLAPVSALGSPLRHGRGCEKPDFLLSCMFNGWEECGHGHKLITRVLKVHHWSRADGLILKKKSYSPERCRGAAIQARPRMSEPQLWAVIV